MFANNKIISCIVSDILRATGPGFWWEIAELQELYGKGMLLALMVPSRSSLAQANSWDILYVGQGSGPPIEQRAGRQRYVEFRTIRCLIPR